MKIGDILLTGGALAALGVAGWFGYRYLIGAGARSPCAGIDTTRACDMTKGITSCCGEPVVSQTNPGEISQKFTITPSGDVTIAAPKDITANPCPTGYYKTAAAAMDAFVKAHSLQSISGTWRYEYLPDRPECFRIASVLTSTGEIR